VNEKSATWSNISIGNCRRFHPEAQDDTPGDSGFRHKVTIPYFWHKWSVVLVWPSR